ncbi:hypothetical protein QTP88_005058 [Uroleucon formosanum]
MKVMKYELIIANRLFIFMRHDSETFEIAENRGFILLRYEHLQLWQDTLFPNIFDSLALLPYSPKSF